MTPTETVKLVRFVKALCPQQAIDAITPDAWHEVIGHLELQECWEAATAVARRQPFIAPAEIIREIADRRSADQPHSEACRIRNCRDCRVGWCSCTCHPRAVDALTGPPKPAVPAIARREGSEPRQLDAADLVRAVRRSP